MKKIIFILFLAFPTFAIGQFGVSYHQSTIPFVGFNYDINNKLRTELRIGTNYYFDFLNVEAVITYDIVNKEDYEIYAGLGGRVNGYSGIVIPLGINIYPLAEKKFGFHIELAPIIGDTEILRGSWGIRYRFMKE